MNDQTPIQSLVEIPASDALAVFSAPRIDGQPHPIDRTLARVRSEVDRFRAEVVDLDKPGDRKRIASMAYRIAQSKTALEKVGEQIARDAKEVPKRIDATRKYAKDTLDAWRDEVRAPLDAWETKEQARQEQHARTIGMINDAALTATQITTKASEIKRLLDQVEAVAIGPECEDYEAEYRIARDGALPKMRDALARAEKAEAEQAELAKLRKAAAEREAADRAEALRKEGEERARLEAENDARAERERVAREAARKEAEHKAAIADAERRAAEAAAAERTKIAAEKAAADAAAAKRENDKKHKAKVQAAIVSALKEHGADAETAAFLVALIHQGKIPHVTITY